MVYEIVRHPRVKNDLLDIVIFVGEYAGYDIAQEKIDQIEASIRSLARFPHTGARRDDIYSSLRVIPSAGKAVICFTTDDATRSVNIVFISYGGMDWQARVQERV